MNYRDVKKLIPKPLVTMHALFLRKLFVIKVGDGKYGLVLAG
jgi:hypothetical protein